jgi:hypothetical protein
MIIDITQKDIHLGIKEDGLKCPVSLAINRKTLTDVHIDKTHLFTERKIIELPKEVKDFIWQFDNNHEVFPFSFELLIPDNVKEEDDKPI